MFEKINAYAQRLKARLSQSEKTVLAVLEVYFDAHRFIGQNRLRKYLLISGIAFLFLFSLIINAILYAVDALEPSISEVVLPFVKKFTTIDAGYIQKGVQGAFWLTKKTIEGNKDAIFGFVFMVVGVPYFSFISAKTEDYLHQTAYPFSWGSFFKEIRRGLSISIRTTFKQFLAIIGITVLSFIPVLGIVAPLLTFIVQAYYNGIILTDYTLERRGYSVRESLQFYEGGKDEMFAIGLGFMFLLLVPVVGWFLAPTYGLVASALLFLRLEKTGDLKPIL